MKTYHDLWQSDGHAVARYYQEKLIAEGIGSARSLAERNDEKDWRFFAALFADITIPNPLSILDVGCGRADVLSYLSTAHPHVVVTDYVGIDLVAAYIAFDQTMYPHYTFIHDNFITTTLPRQQTFDLVLALGVFVSRVQHYELFIQQSVQKMVDLSHGAVLFNCITALTSSHQHYRAPEQIGRITDIPMEQLTNIVSTIDDVTHSTMRTHHLFDDAQDTFVTLHVGPKHPS